MQLLILLATSTILAPLIIFALVSEVTAPLWLLLPALAFALLIIAATAMGRWFSILMLLLVRMILVPLATALLALWAIAIAQAVTTSWIFWPILMVTFITLVVGLTMHEPPQTYRHQPA